MTADAVLFDSHCSATVDGTWLDGRPGLTLAAMAAELRAAGYTGGLAQGMPGVGGYSHAAFAAAARSTGSLVPVAGWAGTPADSTAETMAELRALGFIAIHVHPRCCGAGPGDSLFEDLLRAAADADLPVCLCTYQFADVGLGLPVDPLPPLAESLRRVPDVRVVLLHGGTVELLRYAEFTRANPRVLLDLSFTVMRYEGTRLDDDLRYVIRTLDRRTCIGTDAPEYSPVAVRDRFEALCRGLPEEKRLNVGGRSLRRFLRLEHSE